MTSDIIKGTPVEILLVEDSLADADLAREALEESKLSNNLTVVEDGELAMDYLHKKGRFESAVTPDLIILDLNLPKMDGREVLKAIKEDAKLKLIPVVIMTTSEAEEDIITTYNLHANCYITKPINLDQFAKVVRSVEDFWLTIVKLPPKQQ